MRPAAFTRTASAAGNAVAPVIVRHLSVSPPSVTPIDDPAANDAAHATMPIPPMVAPDWTFSVMPAASEPSTSSLPATTVQTPVAAFAPESVSVPEPFFSMWKRSGMEKGISVSPAPSKIRKGFLASEFKNTIEPV